jgi:mevalonate kinase
MTLRASACGKLILLGEHAVVYGHPAVAVPVGSLRVRAELEEGPLPLRIVSPAVGLDALLDDLPAHHPLVFCIRRALETLHARPPTGRMTIASEIPVASGLGSGAAVSTAVVRVLALSAGRELSPAEVSGVVFEAERIYHGTPSGVDNTVIAYERPVFFRRGQDPVTLAVGAPMQFLIADSGVRSETRGAVGGVRERRQAAPDRYDGYFRQIGELAEKGREYLEAGDRESLGDAMNRCHDLLRSIGVSTPGLDRLVKAARDAGALGAKLTGAGLGGNAAVLIDPEQRAAVESALLESGAAAVHWTRLAP